MTGIVAGIGLRFRRGFARVIPDPFAIAVVLTVVVMLASLAYGRAPGDMLRDWGRGDGLWKLLTFTMQMCAMLVLGTALAAAPAVQRAIVSAAGIVRTPRALVSLTAAVAIALSLVNWSLGLIGGALFAREAGRAARERGLNVHYPLLCAAGYSGLMTWHGGLSGSAPLKAASEAGMIEVLGVELATRAGGTIPLEHTTFSTLNLFVSGGLLVLGPLLFWLLTPEVDREATPAPDLPALEDTPIDQTPRNRLERFERSPVLTWMLVVPMAATLAHLLFERGLSGLEFDTVNLALWCVALALHRRPDRFVLACEQGIRGCTGIVLQFPLYGGIMGMMIGSGLSAAMSRALAGVGPDGFAVACLLFAGLLNLFVPSGGGQWAVQGPIFVEAALEIGERPATAVMTLAYGDQWTNMLQPFWALPLLAITGARARDIIGYATVWMLAGGAWIALGLWLLG